MISSNLLNFSNEFYICGENLSINQDYFSFSHSFPPFKLFNFNVLFLLNNTNFYNESLLSFITQTQDASFFDNLENLKTTYHYSIPNVRLSYPEPFIASASFIHSDL